MKTRNRIDSRLAFVMAVVMGVVFCGASADAQTVWNGSVDGKWSTAGNWDGGLVPVNGNSLTFSGTTRQANTNDAVVTSINILTLNNGGWDIGLGGAAVTITGITATNSSSLTGNVIMSGGTPRTISLSGTTSTLTLGGKLTLGRTDTMALNVNGGVDNILDLGSLDIGGNYARTINAAANVIVNGAMTGGHLTRTVTKSGTGTLTLNGINTYVSATAINAGTFALGASASINNTTNITIAAGATFDVSAQSSYTLSTNLTARGIAATPATIKGASAGTVSLGGNTVTLNWGGASSGVVSDSPPLTIADAELLLNNDPLIINVLGTALGEGVYTLISTTGDGSISGTVNSTPVYSGNGQDPGLPVSVKTAISISGNSVILTIAVPPSGTVIIIR